MKQIFQSRPWSTRSVIIISLLLGFGSSLFIVWQSLVRLGKKKEARNFLLISGLIFILVFSVEVLFFDLNKSIWRGLSIVFPVWFISAHMREWENKNPGKAQFQWSIIVWGLLGMLVSVILSGTLIFIEGLFLTLPVYPRNNYRIGLKTECQSFNRDSDSIQEKLYIPKDAVCFVYQDLEDKKYSIEQIDEVIHWEVQYQKSIGLIGITGVGMAQSIPVQDYNPTPYILEKNRLSLTESQISEILQSEYDYLRFIGVISNN